MSSYYIILGVSPEASAAEIESAYRRQIDRYNPDLVSGMDPELHQVAKERTGAIQQAYHILADPERRRQYDISLGIGPGEEARAQVAARRSLTPRERLSIGAGALAALALIAVIWVLTGRTAPEEVRAMGEVNRPAPAIDLPTASGGQVNLADFRGQVVLVNFWGTWCEPCKREMPALQSAYSQLRDQGFTIIGVNLADDEATNGTGRDEIQAFVEQYGVTYPIALDIEGSVTNAYRVFPLPTSFFIDAEGNIRYVHIGELTLDDVTARFNQLSREATAQSDQ